MPGQSPMLAACNFLPHSAKTWNIRWSFLIAMFILYMSPVISLIWGLILTVVALREGFQKNVKLGLLAEPPLTPPPLLTWAPLLGKIVVLSRF